MAEFQDGEGRACHPVIDLGVVEAFDRESDLGMFESMVGGTRAALLKAPRVLLLLWLSVAGEAKERGVDRDGFRALLNVPGVFGRAFNALMDALNEFFPLAEPTIPGMEGDDEERPTSPGDGLTFTGLPPSPGSRAGDDAASES